MGRNDDIYQYFRCVEWSFPHNGLSNWDKLNQEWSQNYDKYGHCTNEARSSKITCKRCHAYYT